MNHLHTALLAAGLGVAMPLAAQDVPRTLTLSTAIEKALSSSPLITSAEADVRAAEGAERQAGMLSNPELGLEADNLAGSGDYKGTKAAEYTYSLSQKIELGGKRASRRNVAGAERQASLFTVQAAKLDAIHATTTAYGEVLATTEKLKLVEERESLAKDVLATVQHRVGAARDPLIYKSQAEVAKATATLERQKAQRDLQLARRKLASMWGEGAFSEPLDSGVLNSPTEPQALDVYTAKLEQTPTLQRYQAIRTARESSVKLEKAGNVPDPSISVGVRDFRESGHQAMVLGVSMPIPVFNRNQGTIARAQADVVQVEQESILARRTAEQTLQEAWQDWQSAYAETQELQARIIPAAQQALSLSRQGYERGRFSFLEVLTAQRTLADAQEQHVNARQRQLNARAEVERLTATSSFLKPSQPETTR